MKHGLHNIFSYCATEIFLNSTCAHPLELSNIHVITHTYTHRAPTELKKMRISAVEVYNHLENHEMPLLCWNVRHALLHHGKIKRKLKDTGLHH